MKQILVSAVVSIAILGLGLMYLQKHPEALMAAHAPSESAYDRIIRTGEIHCGYTSWDPLFFVDKDGKKKGIFHDVMEEIGNRLGVRVVWQEEIGWGSLVDAIKSKRVDAACAGYWLNMGRIKNLEPSLPQLYSPLYVWVRQDDPRAFNSFADLNSDKLTVASIDGSAESQAIARRFPKAKVLSLPELDTNSDEIEALMTKKADYVILEAASVKTYMANNPGKIRMLFPDRPVVVFPTVMLLPPDAPRLKEVIDNTLRNIEYDGTLDAILKTYDAEHDFLRNPPPVKAN